MKVTKSYIKQLVKEELNKVLKENQGIADPDGVLQFFGAGIKEVVQDNFKDWPLRGGALSARKDGHDYVIVIEFGGGIPSEPLVYLNPNTNMLSIPEKPAKTENENANKKINDMKSKMKRVVELDNLAMQRSLKK